VFLNTGKAGDSFFLFKSKRTMISASTNYYRKNKKTKKVVHVCPRCDYSTTGPKITLKNHILSKHTAECDRPFQCMHAGCNRGFAQKQNYQNHLCKVHGEKKLTGKKKKVLYYTIKIGDEKPSSKKTRERMAFYKKNVILTTNKIRENITMSCFHYDVRHGFIKSKTITENYVLNNVMLVSP
jgi:hypothetical protein